MSTVTVVATVEADNSPPRVRLDVTDFGSPENFSVTVTRLDPDGRLVSVRTSDGDPLTLTTSGITRVGLVYDYEVPYGAIVQYSTVEDPTSSSGEVTVPSARPWLVHPGVPEMSQQFVVAGVGARVRKVTRSVLYPMGRATPLVQTDGVRKAAEYTLSVLTTSDGERRDLGALLDEGGPLLLNIPAVNPWGMPTEYVSVGDVSEARAVRFLGEPIRVWELPCTVIDRPSGGTTAERTYVDLLAFASYADVLATYPTYADLLAGP